MPAYNEKENPLKNTKKFRIHPGSFPFFYGWVILAVSTVGMMMSIPGQTVGVSVFTDFLIEALSLSRNAVSLAYLVGTVASAFVLPFGGRAYDRFGGRKVGVIVVISLALTLLLLSFSDYIARFFSFGGSIPPAAAAFSVLSFGFFMLRFFGQGVLSMVSRNLVMEWFEKLRGRANAVLGVAIALGFSLAPQVFDGLIQQAGWRGAWRFLALIVGLFSIAAFLLFRDKPEDFGLIPDGKVVEIKRVQHADAKAGRDFTLKEARKRYSFWLFLLTVTLSSLAITAFTFHVVSIFEEAGLSRARAVTIFFPASLVAVVFQFFGSWVSDYVQMKWFALIQNIGVLLVGVGMILLSRLGLLAVLVLGMGLIQGMMGITLNITWARFFGRRHLGSITGFAMAWTVAGSAVGPYFFSMSLNAAGSYNAAAAICLAMGALLALGSFWAKRPS